MRPVNLIPPDERRGDSAPLRLGSLIYVLTGGLALLLLGIVAVALTSKQVSDREDKKAGLEQELQQATARAQSVQAFTAFRTVQQQRSDTVSSLAASRFDWSRVLEELARVLPSNVILSGLKGTVNPDVQIESGSAGGSEGSDLRSAVEGPALEINGCAPSQDAVAGFISGLEDIDGVTRVGMDSSELPDVSASGSDPSTADGTGGSGEAGDCQSILTPAKFKLIVAFDAVATPPAATSSPSVPPAAAAPTGSDQSQVADAQTQENVQRASVREQTTKAEKAKSQLIPGGG